MDLKHLIPHQRRRGAGPVLDLQFAIDKSLTARVGPTPVFTRASGATFVDSDGLIKFAPENLLRQSQNFADSAWITFGNAIKIRASTIADPAGGLSAREINVGTGAATVYQQYTTAFQAARCTYSVWVRSVSGTSDFVIRNNSGTVTTPSSIFTATTTWTRFQFTFTDIIYQFQIGAASANAVGNIIVWGAQAERSDTARTYIPTTTAAVYRPRFDHDPVTLVSKGLLMEETRTNLLLQSANFATSWTASQLNTTGTPAYSNVALAPDGSLNADKLIANTGTSTHQFRQSNTVNGTYTLSCYFKAAETSNVSMALFGTATGNADWYSFFNVSTGVITGTRTGFTASSIANVGNGWYRCTATFTTTASGTAEIRIGGANVAGNSTVYAGDDSSGFYVWGAQLEAGTFASSYIPTTTGGLARSADICSITGTAFSNFCNQTEGTLRAKLTIVDRNSQFGLGGIILSATDRFNCSVSIIKKNNIITSYAIRSYNAAAASLSFTTAYDVEDKIIFAFKQDSYASACSGSAVQVDNVGSFDTVTYPLNQMIIGSNISNRMFGWISSIQYYRQRLPNSSLQALSTIVTNTITYNGVQIQFNSDTNGLQTTN